MITSGVISEIIGMLPAMNTTEPYSPIARAKASANPVASAGRIAGKITRTNVCNREAPSVAAASSLSRSNAASTGCTERTTNGNPTKINAMTTPIGVNATFMPHASSM